jgi:hydroxyethylthiazole kinase-like uncharacterized protein yjeF
MMKVVSVEEMKAVEKHADADGISYDRMMQNAGRGVADWILEHALTHRGVIGLVGSGNNGGDTLVALTLLSQRGIRTNVFIVRQRMDDPLISAYISSGGAVIDISQEMNLEVLQATLIPGAVLLDGILGTGLRLPIREDLHGIMTRISKLVKNRSDALKIAVDCPSGVDCNTGEVSDATIHADHTLCMAAIKQGLLKPPSRSYCGEIHGIDIGINESSGHLLSECPEMLDAEFVKTNLPERPDTGHKGTFGTCMVIAGSRPYTGAAFLSGKGAYRAGCGLVHIATTQPVYESLAGQLVEAVWTVLPNLGEGYNPQGVTMLAENMQNIDAVVVGPGWGLHKESADFLEGLLKVIPGDMPALFDADGLKLLSRVKHWWTLLPEHTVLTPHPGEMSILSGLEIHEIQANRWEIAEEYAERWGVVMVLKGAVTVIAEPGGRVFINPTSSSSLATAGSGDVLSGLIGGLLAQHVPSSKAAAAGVWLHAQAGLFAAYRRDDEASVTAKDILDGLSPDPDPFGTIFQ